MMNNSRHLDDEQGRFPSYFTCSSYPRHFHRPRVQRAYVSYLPAPRLAAHKNGCIPTSRDTVDNPARLHLSSTTAPTAMPCYVMLCLAMLCLAMLCLAMLCYVMLCLAMLCLAMLSMPCYTMPCYAMPCYAMLCHAMLCYDMLYYALPCYALLCHAMRAPPYLLLTTPTRLSSSLSPHPNPALPHTTVPDRQPPLPIPIPPCPAPPHWPHNRTGHTTASPSIGSHHHHYTRPGSLDHSPPRT